MEKAPKIEGGEEQPINLYEPLTGNVNKTVEQIITLAKETKKNVIAKFNGIELMANQESTADDIINDFLKKSDKATEIYDKSPEGQSAARESEESKEKAQMKADALVEQLSSLDFTNQELVLDWVCEFQYPSDHGDVVNDQGKILEIFSEHGYYPKVNTDEALNREDSDNFARFIIGQALDGLRNVHAVPQIVHGLTDDWKKKFAS